MLARIRKVAGLAVLLLGAAAQARMVSVQAGLKVGQGWMFLDTDGHCKVLTPAHVVLAENGEVMRTLTVSDARLGSVTSAMPVILSARDKLDVAVLPLRGADDPTLCGSGRVSGIGIQRRIVAMNDVRLERMDGGATMSSEVHLRSRSTYDDKAARSPLNEEGTRFTVLSATDRVVGGWSGSGVIDQDGTLLGMITDADEFEQGAGVAVAASALRYLLDTVRSSGGKGAAGALPQAAVRVLTGVTNDTARNQDEVFDGNGPGWQVTPVGRQVSFSVLFAASTHLSGVSLRVGAGTNAAEGVELASPVSPEGDAENSWLSLNYCRLTGAPGMIRCASVGTTQRRVRVTLRMKDNTPVQLYGLTIEP